MKCPHCNVEIHPGFTQSILMAGNSVARIGRRLDSNIHQNWATAHMECPACAGAIIQLHRVANPSGAAAVWPSLGGRLVHPSGVSRPKPSADVPSDFADDYDEAANVLGISPKSSAALSRRCVQAVLRHQGFTQHDLAKAIQAAIDSKQLPSSLADNLDSIRHTGNFAAHPMKDTNTGEILPVEPHEAEWNLEVLEGLFDFFYVQPAKDKARRDALNAKLAAAGKPAMK